MITFMRTFLGVKTDQAVQAGVEALVRWDPQAATEAELRTMERHLDELGLQVAQARAAYDRERQEAVAIKGLLQQRMAAAEQLERQRAIEPTPERKTALEKSLATLVGMLEQMTPEVEREAQDETEAQEFLAMLEKTYADAGAKLRAARSQLERAHRDMGRAEQQREMAERRAEAARQAAGLSHTTNSLNVALKAMQDTAAKDLMAAEAAGEKARLLTADAARAGRPQHCRRARLCLRCQAVATEPVRRVSLRSKRTRFEPLAGGKDGPSWLSRWTCRSVRKWTRDMPWVSRGPGSWHQGRRRGFALHHQTPRRRVSRRGRDTLAFPKSSTRLWLLGHIAGGRHGTL